MKKFLFCMVAACGLMLCSCSKNPAEDYEGTYNVNSDVTYTSTSKAGISNTESGTIKITLNGDDGDVTVTGLFNTTGNVDEDGVLHLNSETHAGAELGAGISLLGYDLAGVHFTTQLHHGDITIGEDGKMTWSSNGLASATVGLLGLEVDVHANASYSNTAVRQ